MQKVIKLQSVDLTHKKQLGLSDTRIEAKRIIKKFILPNIDSCEDNGQLQQLVYHNIRKESFLPSQVLLNLIRSSFHLKQKPVEKRNTERITLDYNIPRACKMFMLNEKKLCFAITLKPRHRIVIPIENNGSVMRFQKQIDNGWKIKQVGLTNRNDIIATIEKKKVRKDYKNILGIDTNSNNVSITALTPQGKTMKQLYLGKNLYDRKAKILKRRAILQSHADKGSSKAQEKLRKLSRKVMNINKNAVGEISKQIHEIAEKYGARIVFERLHKFEANKNKAFNRKVTLIPFRMLTMTTAIRSVDTGVPMGYVDSYHTSKWCSGCGSVNPPHDSSNYAIYRCGNCGLVVNSDRKASLAVAVKKFAERKECIMPLKAPSDRAESFTLLSIKIAMEKKFCEHLTAYGRGKCKHDPLQTKWCAHSRNKGKLLCCPINKTITKKEWKLQWHWEFREHERNSLIGREKLRKYSRTYHSRHREEVNEWHNIWLRKRLKDPVFKEKYLEYQRNYRNTEKFKANQKKYRESEGYKKHRREIETPTHADFERNKELAKNMVTSDGMAYSTGFVVHKVKIGDLYFCVYKKRGISGYRIQEIKYGKYEKWHDSEDYIEFFKSIGIQTKKEEGAKGQEKEMPNLQGEGSKDKADKLAERQSVLPIRA